MLGYNRLTLVQLTQGTDEFQRSLHESGKFFVDSMYKASIYSNTVDDNKKWKIKKPLKTKKSLCDISVGK
jgi:hypothetical protein